MGNVILVSGGSGSGKSAYAEERCIRADGEERIYIATMRVWDEEGKKRVLRHQKLREGKGFQTLECPTSLHELSLSHPSVILLECMSNLVLNEFYDYSRKLELLEEYILKGIAHLSAHCDTLVIVTNEIFSDGLEYEEETRTYLTIMGDLNQKLAMLADEVVEVVYSIPITIKQREEER